MPRHFIIKLLKFENKLKPLKVGQKNNILTIEGQQLKRCFLSEIPGQKELAQYFQEHNFFQE